MKEKLGNKVSGEKFAQMIDFLNEENIRVEKQTSSLNQVFAGGPSRGKSVVNVVTGAVTLTTNQVITN